MEKEVFAARLKRIRKERCYTQEELAKITKISVQTIRNYEQGNNEPVAVYLLELAKTLDVTPDYLLLGEENMNTYTKAIEAELKQLSEFEKIKEIKAQELNATILSHLELSEELVTSIKDAWEEMKLFTREKEDNNGNKIVEESYCTRNYVREIILRYCQNRTYFKTKFEIQDGMILNMKQE
ncbi:helix-turn-helix transcriptional regulator [Clostridium sp. KNHs214]|uniref:helix-turn-helix domain-containing protein n=1 Tax=Clostridium sp. KNHs214 TaxID=1540257 RepID=UPI000B0203BA|nr:helix-turn-helix transcriptional regulator [Clostridium sp. KNHs214]